MAALYKTDTGSMFHAGKIAIIMVGLPARGKTYISQKLARYLKWMGVQTAVFDVGKYRRDLLGAKQSPEFFDHDNKEGMENRMRVMQAALQNMIAYFRNGGQVGIYDATNSTEKARRFLLDSISHENLKIQTIFVECVCDDLEVIKATVDEETMTSPDYLDLTRLQAAADFETRIGYYLKSYEPVEDPSLSYVKLINVGQRLFVNRVKGYLPTRIVYFLMNTHIVRRNIFLCRDGQSNDDARYLQGATANLSKQGQHFSHKLKDFMKDNHSRLSPLPSYKKEERPLLVWTSTSARSKQTAALFSNVVEWKALVDLNPGVTDGLSEDEIKLKYPADYEMHLRDPYHHRYPRAESFHDLAMRLEPVILELERQSKDVMIIAHETVLRCLVAYFNDYPSEDIPTLEIAENTVIQLVPHAYKCDMVLHKISV